MERERLACRDTTRIIYMPLTTQSAAMHSNVDSWKAEMAISKVEWLTEIFKLDVASTI
jgi:hypothetical protein